MTNQHSNHKDMREYLRAKLYSGKRKYAFEAQNISAFEKWKAHLRSELAWLIGLDRMVTCELLPQRIESVSQEGYRREKWVIQTEPGIWMPFYWLIPDEISLSCKLPCIVAPHGHGGQGKAMVAGVMDDPLVQKAWQTFHADYGRQLVREGFIVLCPDARGAGERQEWMVKDGTNENAGELTCNALNNAAMGLGMTLTGMWVWDLMRLLDYLETVEFIDMKKVGCCGFSGGGLQALWLAALDERVQCAVVSGYFHGYHDTLLRNNLCGCNFVPRLWEYLDMGDLGALVAPKPLLIESGKNDHLNGERRLESVYEQLAISRSAYQLFGQAERLNHSIFEGKHQWNGATVGDFFKCWIGFK